VDCGAALLPVPHVTAHQLLLQCGCGNGGLRLSTRGDPRPQRSRRECAEPSETEGPRLGLL
jgi:hypothetical protein